MVRIDGKKVPQAETEARRSALREGQVCLTVRLREFIEN